MRRCADSDDYDMIRHAHRVLAALGDEASAQWLVDDEEERIAAYLERQGFTDMADLPEPPCAANGADEQEGAA